MKYILDTHTFLWSLFDPKKLSKPVVQVISSQENDVAVSVVSFWEISLKYAIGKLELYGIEPDELPDCAEQTDLFILPLDPTEAASFYKLPRDKHKNPFDRLIIWQAIQRKIILLSRDQSFQNYREFGLKTYW